LIFIGASIENPFHSIIAPLVSRCHIFEFNRLSLKEIGILAIRAIKHYKSFGQNISIDKDAVKHFMRMSCGDGRKILNLIELAVDTGEKITLKEAKNIAPSKFIHFSSDDHFDLASAFQQL
jgi:putative ATPase